MFWRQTKKSPKQCYWRTCTWSWREWSKVFDLLFLPLIYHNLYKFYSTFLFCALDIRAAREKNGVYIPHERFVQDEEEKKVNISSYIPSKLSFCNSQSHLSLVYFQNLQVKNERIDQLESDLNESEKVIFSPLITPFSSKFV